MSALTDYIDKDLIKKYGKTIPSDCIVLDEMIKKISDELNQARQEKKDGYYILKLENLKLDYQKEFVKKACRDEIEKIRIEDTGKTLSDFSAKQELDVLGKNKQQQWIYIGLGSIVLITALFIVIRKK